MIHELLNRIAEKLVALQDEDLVRILIRGNDRQPIGFQELQIIYTGSTATQTQTGSAEQIAAVDLYLITQELFTPKGAYVLIPRIVNHLYGFCPFQDYGSMRYLGDRKTAFDESQQILGFTLSYQVPIPPF